MFYPARHSRNLARLILHNPVHGEGEGATVCYGPSLWHMSEVSRKAPQKDSICYVAYDRFKNSQLMLTITHCEHQIKIEVHSSSID